VDEGRDQMVEFGGLGATSRIMAIDALQTRWPVES
jgi:hypothetical protein